MFVKSSCSETDLHSLTCSGWLCSQTVWSLTGEMFTNVHLSRRTHTSGVQAHTHDFKHHPYLRMLFPDASHPWLLFSPSHLPFFNTIITSIHHPSSSPAQAVSFSSPSSISPYSSSQQAFWNSVGLINKKILLTVSHHFQLSLVFTCCCRTKIHETLCLFDCLRSSPSSVIAQLIGVICFELFL